MLSLIGWILAIGSLTSANASCPEANLRVQSTHIPAYMLNNNVASSETMEDGDLKFSYDTLIAIPAQYVSCPNNQIDYSRSLMNWTQKAKGSAQTQIAKFDAKQNSKDVFFPVEVRSLAGGSVVPQDSPVYLNLMTLYTNKVLVEADQNKKKSPNEKPAVVNPARLDSIDMNYISCPGGYCSRIPGPTNLSPTTMDPGSKNHKRLEREEFNCQMNGKNVCEDIKPVVPYMTRDFLEKYAYAQSTSVNFQEAFIEAFTPIAVWLQLQTGIPASQLLAQLIQETSRGGNFTYQLGNNIGGLSCGRASSNTQSEINFYGKKFFIADKDCNTKKSGEPGYYASYSSIEESILDWAFNFLTTEHNYYPNIRNKSIKAKENGAYRVFDFSGSDLIRYAADGSYTSAITSHYNYIEGKYKLKSHPCQVCMQKQWEQKAPARAKEVSK